MQTYTVIPGDYLSKIGLKTGHDWREIARVNNINYPYIIHIGQILNLPGTDDEREVFNYKTFTKMYGHRPVRIFVCTFPADSVKAEIVFANSKAERVSSMAKRTGADLAVNCSFFWDGLVMGRHIKNGKAIYTYTNDYPTIVIDNWRLDAYYLGGVKRLVNGGVQNCFSAYPYLLYRGNQWISKHSSSLAGLNPRTALGKTEDGRLIVLVADGRQYGYSHGLTTRELSNLMIELGSFEWAINLDGGGSSTFYFGGKVRNRPSDGRERPVVNALAFKAK